MTLTIHDRAIHSEARELCLALAKVCLALHQWDGAHILQHAAQHLYTEKYRALFRAEAAAVGVRTGER